MVGGHLPLPACIAAAKAGRQPAHTPAGVGDRISNIFLLYLADDGTQNHGFLALQQLCMSPNRQGSSILSAANGKRENPIFLVVVSPNLSQSGSVQCRYVTGLGKSCGRVAVARCPFGTICNKESRLVLFSPPLFFHLKDGLTDRHILCTVCHAPLCNTGDPSAKSRRRNHVAPLGCIREAPCCTAGPSSRARW